jgi:hypothetical protein
MGVRGSRGPTTSSGHSGIVKPPRDRRSSAIDASATLLSARDTNTELTQATHRMLGIFQAACIFLRLVKNSSNSDPKTKNIFKKE